MMRSGSDTRLTLIIVLVVIQIILTFVDLLTGQDRITIPADAANFAAQDLVAMPAIDRPFQLYVWGLPITSDWQRINCFAVNMAASQSARVIYPVSVGRGHLLRWDLRAMGVTPEGTARLRKLLIETCVLDPFFYENATATVVNTGTVTIKYGLVADGNGGKHWVPWDDIPSGAYYWDTKFFTESVGGDVTKDNRQLAAHLGIEQRELLFELAGGNPAPIVSARHLLEVLLTTTGIGRYYDFVGVAGKDRDEILASLGASQKISGRLNAVTGWAFVQSKVTGKWRIVLWFQGATGPTFATLDFDDTQTSSKENPFYQLIATLDGFLGGTNKPLHVAEEIISLRPNGSQVGYLINAADGNKLADSVPETIAKDHNIPSPGERGGSGSALLIPNTGCIICHGPNGGYQPLGTVMSPAKLKRLDIFDDFQARDDFEAIDQLSAIFGKGADKLTTHRALQRATEDYGTFVFRSTKGWKTEEMSEKFREYFYGWKYDLVTPRQACLELGYQVAEDADSEAILNKLIPDAAPIEGSGVAYEDRTIGFLKSGIPVQRHAWNEIYAHAATRRKELKNE